MSDLEPDFDHIPADPPALEAIARAERFLDALAAGQQVVELDDPGDEALAVLLGEWRDRLRWPPAGGLVSESEAMAALRDGAAPRRRTRRVLAAVGSVAATVLSLGGFGAVVAQTHPGEPLYGLHMMMFGEPPLVHDDRIALAAKTELDKVQQMIDQGQWDQAQEKLTAVSSNVQTVNDTDRKQDLIGQVNRLNAKVASRDPNATPAPGSSPSPLATRSNPATRSVPEPSTTRTPQVFSAVPSDDSTARSAPDTATTSGLPSSAPWPPTPGGG